MAADNLHNLFPHDSVRKIQEEILVGVESCIKNKKNLLMHAPTGLGKTASTLPLALSYGLKDSLTVFFLTSRHTQHKIAIDTLKEIKKKHSVKFNVSDIIGKKWMCSQPGVEKLFSTEFADYCKALRLEGKCEFYSRTITQKMGLTPEAKKAIGDISAISPCHSEDVINICRSERLCPYEIALKLSSKANVIISDYNYIFNPTIQENFFKRTNKELCKSIIIVDEAHNLPLRVRELMTERLSSFIVKRALKESKKFGYDETKFVLERILEILNELARGMVDEKLVRKEEFISKVTEIDDYEKIIMDMKFIGDTIRETQKQSYIGSVARFLESWQGEDESFARILERKQGFKGEIITLSYRCLDPSLLTAPVFKEAYSSILMSGTLTPTEMYRDVLGLGKDTVEKIYQSPFPATNKLSMIVPETTTKFTARNEEQFKRIGEITADIVNTVPGNCALFFPSYFMRDNVDKYFMNLCNKTTLMERPRLSKEEKLELLETFKKYNQTGAVLMAASSGSFGEGIDLPGDLLKCVVVVGLPLGKPDLEIKELINYYDKKFSRGWDYGYVFPAFIKCLQNAGRCIRSETDRGVIVFLDQRFTWQNYYKCFPRDMGVKVTKRYVDEIKEFFG